MKKTFKVKGMHCKSCEMLITDSLEEAGANSVSADWEKGAVEVDYDGDTLPDSRISSIIKDEGYEVV